MPSSEAAHGLLASLARQKVAVAGLVLMGLLYGAFLVGMKRGSVSFVTRVHRLRAAQLAEELEAMARELPTRPSASLPVEWNLPRLDQERHTVAVGLRREDWGARTDSTEATLLVNLGGPVSGELELVADAKPWLHRKNRRQEVHVLVNGEPVGRWLFVNGEKDKRYTARIPAGLARPGEPLRISFQLPGVEERKALLSTGGSRVSGMGLLRLRLEPVPAGGSVASGG